MKGRLAKHQVETVLGPSGQKARMFFMEWVIILRLGLEAARDTAAVFHLFVLTTFVDGESKFAPADLCGTVMRNSIIEFRSQFLCFSAATSKRYRISLEVIQASKDIHSPTTYETMENIP